MDFNRKRPYISKNDLLLIQYKHQKINQYKPKKKDIAASDNKRNTN